MERLSEQIIQQAAALPEGTPLAAKGLLHLGSRAAVDQALSRLTDRAGGIEGGMSNGEILRVRAAMKPISTVPRALQTIDVASGEASKAHHQRSDVCAVPAAGVVAEAMVALVLANALVEKFGGDSVVETKRNLDSYLASIPAVLRSTGV